MTPEHFLIGKSLITGDCKHFIIDFPDGKEINLGELLTEYAAEKDKELAAAKDRIAELEKEVAYLGNLADVYQKIAANPSNNP